MFSTPIIFAKRVCFDLPRLLLPIMHDCLFKPFAHGDEIRSSKRAGNCLPMPAALRA